MFNLTAIVQKAQSFIDPALSPIISSTDKSPPTASLFRHQFRLPDSQSPLDEITAELKVQTSNVFAGKLYLSEAFLCFSTTASSFLPNATVYASGVNGTGPVGNGFILPLCAIQKVERLYTPMGLFALAVTTWNGLTQTRAEDKQEVQRFTIQLAGSRPACDRFCDGLRKGLRHEVKRLGNLKMVVADCYSEYLLSHGKSFSRDPPDAGLGMLFKYPGDARKLRDASKMRLWREYLRGILPVLHGGYY